MKSAEIREKFLKFFESQGHQRVKSSSLIPAEDPTLLFTNAGMVQFKDCFLGLQDPGYRRATTSQKCVRAGGKHNDLENVGFTPRHHTFFEMLGNFSFGDYFKKDAIAFAWELLTKGYQLPKDKLRITVFRDDDEAAEIWKSIGVRPDWIYRMGEKDNFWAMGDTGPCGPCTEIYFDWGEKYGEELKNKELNDKRFLEIWNLVFMQFNRSPSGEMSKLPKPSVDTGAGLERVASVLQGKYSNYDTDVFTPLIQAIVKSTQRIYGKNESESVAMRVIADHLRSGTFLMSDGVTPSNEGRGYVLRRILRRAIRYGKNLGKNEAFIYHLVPEVAKQLGGIYPELNIQQKLVSELMKEEEIRFHETLHRGMGILEDAIEKTKASQQKTLSGEIAFKLYDTFGFPVDLTAVICREHNLLVDEVGFEKNMEAQRKKSVWAGGDQTQLLSELQKQVEAGKIQTQFLGYEKLNASGKLVLILTAEGKSVNELTKGRGVFIFDKSPFYAESGGQVGDEGEVRGKSNERGNVTDTFKVGKAFAHLVEVQTGKFQLGNHYELGVNSQKRQATAVNHTATHLLHAALRRRLGDRVKQAGSLVDSERLRFDFTFPKALTPEDIQAIENEINREVLKNDLVSVEEMPFDTALKKGALAFFDEKYGDEVRVVRVGAETGAFSVELCGGTHLKSTGEIQLIKILTETSIASGTRRIEAITGSKALEYLVTRDTLLARLESELGAKGDLSISKVESLMKEVKKLRQENEKLQLKAAGSSGGGNSLWEKKELINNYQVVMEKVSGVNPKVLRSLVDQVRDKLQTKVVVALAAEQDEKLALCVGISKDLVGSLDAAKLIAPMAKVLGGSGGGRADFAQAGGSEPKNLSQAFDELRQLLEKN